MHLRAAIWELYPDGGAVPRLRARIDAINQDVLAGRKTLSEASMARLRFLNERLKQLAEAN
jgi:hypothetical protein